jgi:hypothetical protein
MPPWTFTSDPVLTGPVRTVDPRTLRLVPAAMLDGVDMKLFAIKELAIIFVSRTVEPKLRFPATVRFPATDRFRLTNMLDMLLTSANVVRVFVRTVLPKTFKLEATDKAPPTLIFNKVDKFP